MTNLTDSSQHLANLRSITQELEDCYHAFAVAESSYQRQRLRVYMEKVSSGDSHSAAERKADASAFILREKVEEQRAKVKSAEAWQTYHLAALRVASPTD